MKNLGIGFLLAAAAGFIGAFMFSEKVAAIIAIGCIVLAFVGACIGNYDGRKK